jgi:molybdopterin molybdotransferase
MVHPVTTRLEDARALVLARAAQLAVETQKVPVMQAMGRISAERVLSLIDLPRTDNAAVDGFAVHADRLAKKPDAPLKIVGMARAGHPFTGIVEPGQAVRIYTGAMVPEGPDCILMHEDCTDNGDSVICGKILARGTNIRPRGENLAAGECVAEKGQRITAADMGQLAASGQAEIQVYRRLKVAIYSTGDEIIETGQKLQDGQIYDSNRAILAGLLAHENVEQIDGGIVADQKQALISAYKQGLADADIVISSGGASDGIEDHSQSALAALGAECLFWRLAMKPGRPMAVAEKDGQMIFCLPGNPVAAFVCFKLLVAPVIDMLSGRVPRDLLKVRLAAGFEHKKRAGRAEYLRARLSTDDTGRQQITLHGRKGAGVISSLTGADGLVEIPFDCEGVCTGDMLSFIPFQEQAL